MNEGEERRNEGFGNLKIWNDERKGNAMGNHANPWIENSVCVWRRQAWGQPHTRSRDIAIGVSETRKERSGKREGFVQPIGSGRPTHVKPWPKGYANGADGDLEDIARCKNADLATEDSGEEHLASAEVEYCLEENWGSDLHDGISTLLVSLWTLFAESRILPAKHLPRTQVTHDYSIEVLDEWLEAFRETEQEFSNCPFT
ncbi:hypothetical protein PAXRUDRAFT_703639 [Paxillus rubicundulus Ve08.2h10]|uniref:Uncharacterized protein n=1 Tax=Paxillus rubicundulus Ve08.2h10 TaxID=930991 RepID=A0A0D0DT70_9AGAM|nr:hypothetical protein PAXRUDRAFT_703639 [Paxillus rubicundulus Ve08.2h10]